MQDGICWITESVPNNNTSSVPESEITLVVKGGGCDAKAGSAGLPDYRAGAVEEAEVSVREEVKGAPRIDRGGGDTRLPDGEAGEGDASDVGTGVIGVGDEGEGEVSTWGLPGGCVVVGSEGGAWPWKDVCRIEGFEEKEEKKRKQRDGCHFFIYGVHLGETISEKKRKRKKREREIERERGEMFEVFCRSERGEERRRLLTKKVRGRGVATLPVQVGGVLIL